MTEIRGFRHYGLGLASGFTVRMSCRASVSLRVSENPGMANPNTQNNHWCGVHPLQISGSPDQFSDQLHIGVSQNVVYAS